MLNVLLVSAGILVGRGRYGASAFPPGLETVAAILTALVHAAIFLVLSGLTVRSGGAETQR